jgi:hypothetical protein
MPSRLEQLRISLADRRAKIGDAALNVRRAFGLVWEAHRPSSLVMAACTLAGALLPAGQAWVGKLIVDSVVSAISSHSPASDGLRLALPLLAVEFALLLAAVIGQCVRY